MSIEPANYNLVIYRDRDFSRTFIFKDGDGVVNNLAGYAAAAQIRLVKDSSELIASFTRVITAAEGKVVISLTDVQTLALDESKAWWDFVFTTPSGLREPYIEGAVAIKGTVTRAA